MASLELRVVPNASRDQLVGRHGTALKVKLRAPAVEGKANAALLDFVAAALGIKAGALTLASGEKSRTKRLAVFGLTQAEVDARIEAALKLP